MKNFSKAYAILRLDRSKNSTSIENQITVEEVIYEHSFAKVETEQLNKLAEKGVKYFTKQTQIRPRKLKPILQKDAKKIIIKEWHEFKIQYKASTDMDMFVFFLKLRGTMPELTEFKTRGTDPWQIIHAWLLEEER